MKKKLLAALLTLCMLAVSACGGTPSVSPAASGESSAAGGSSTASGAQRTLSIVGSVRRFPGEEDAWKSVIAKFEAENPDIKVNVRWQGQWNEVPQNLSAAKMSGEPVDLFTAGGGVINSTLAPSGSLMDMTELMAPYVDRFNEGMLSAYYIGDKLWGFPYGDADLSCVYYNKTMFDELGLTPPKTFDELVTVANTIREEKGIMPMLHQGKAAWFWPMWFMETYAQTTKNNSINEINSFLADEKQFTGEAETEAFAKIKAFFDNGILTSESLDTDGDGVRAAFSQGKTAMFYGGTWEYAPLLSAMGESNIEVGVFEFPEVVAGVKPQHGGGPGDAFVIPSFAPKENVDMTMRFIEFITRPEIANEIIATYSPNVAVIKGVETVDTPIKTTLNDGIRPNTIAFLDWIWPAEVNDAFVQAIPAALSGQMSPAEATQTVQDALDRIIEEKDYKADWWNAWTPEQWAAVTPATIPDAVK